MPSGPPAPIQTNVGHVDLTQRLQATTAVASSPTGSAETTIATLTIPHNVQVVTGIRLEGWAAFVASTGTTSVRLRIRQATATGSTVADSGAVASTASAVGFVSTFGFDAAAVLPNQTYVMTLTVGAAGTASTASSVYLATTVT